MKHVLEVLLAGGSHLEEACIQTVENGMPAHLVQLTNGLFDMCRAWVQARLFGGLQEKEPLSAVVEFSLGCQVCSPVCLRLSPQQ
jgi:hypothetical protein